MVTVLVTCSRAHPRSHGENRIIASASSTPTGSSPLTRGKQGHLHVGFLRPRLIPTHAGKTKPARAFAGGGWAHPRSRGENQATLYAPPDARGSSPLTRGKHNVANRVKRRHGLIPAHAGKTFHALGQTRLGAAHPHSRGENLATAPPSVNVCGSSPLMQGKRAFRVPSPTGGGLIPAHAGKTRTHGPVHPSRGLIPTHAGKTSTRPG